MSREHLSDAEMIVSAINRLTEQVRRLTAPTETGEQMLCSRCGSTSPAGWCAWCNAPVATPQVRDLIGGPAGDCPACAVDGDCGCGQAARGDSSAGLSRHNEQR